MTAVLALDLSLTSTGVAVPDGTLATIRPTAAGDGRLAELRDGVDKLIVEHAPTVVVLEDLPTHAHAAGITGMVHGAVRVVLLDHGLRYVLVPPATLKVYATGKGTSPKPDMRMELYKRTGVDVPDDNQVDAAWLRLLGLDLAGDPEVSLPQTHRRALDKVKAT